MASDAVQDLIIITPFGQDYSRGNDGGEEWDIDLKEDQFETFVRTINEQLPSNLSSRMYTIGRTNLGITWMFFPQYKQQLESMETLYLSNKNLTVLPSKIGMLTSLKQLDVSNNQLTSLGAIVQLTALKELKVDGNPELTVPEEIRGLVVEELSPPVEQQ